MYDYGGAEPPEQRYGVEMDPVVADDFDAWKRKYWPKEWGLPMLPAQSLTIAQFSVVQRIVATSFDAGWIYGLRAGKAGM